MVFLRIYRAISGSVMIGTALVGILCLEGNRVQLTKSLETVHILCAAPTTIALQLAYDGAGIASLRFQVFILGFIYYILYI